MQLISRKTILAFFLPGALFMGLFMIYPIFKMGLDSLFNFNPNGLREFVDLIIISRHLRMKVSCNPLKIHYFTL